MSNREFTDRIKAAFPGGEPSDEFVSKLEKAVKPRRKIRSFVPATAIVIAVLLFANLGVYAASEISFKDIVTDRVHVANSELAESLIGSVRNFSFKVSDDDYAVRILGVTGSDKNIIGKAEIYRTDGEPVIDHFVKTSEDEKLYSNLSIKDNALFSSSSSHMAGFEINEDGNIIVDWDLSTDHNLNGKIITMRGTNLYFASDVMKFEEENHMSASDYDGVIRFVNEGEKTVNDVSANDLAALTLEWSFSFKYGQSAFSMSRKRCTRFDENFRFINQVNVWRQDDNSSEDLEKFDIEITCVPKSMKFSNTGGTIKFTYTDDYDYEGYISGKYNSPNVHASRAFYLSLENKMYLLKSDGTQINIMLGSGHGGGDVGGTMKMTFDFIYYDPEIKEGSNRIYTDISDVVSVYINGVTYKLK